jgi:3-isopropylmalate/(R)-2-methylmalate dehydratase large subunit
MEIRWIRTTVTIEARAAGNMRMGYTITEKILARAAGLPAVRAGDEIKAKPHFVLAYDWPGQTDAIFRDMKAEFGVPKVADPKRFAIFIDHMNDSPSAKDEEFHDVTRQWSAENGTALYEGKGIGHHVAAEMGYAVPGALVVHFDGHISQLGTYGTLALGLRRALIEAFVRDTVTLRVPKTTRIDFTGRLMPGVMGRDVFHHLVRALGPSSCRFQMMELGGEGVDTLSTDALQAITGLAMFLGAASAIVNPGGKRLEYAQARARLQLEPLYSDADAEYAARHTFDLSTIEPVVVPPPNPANIRDLKEYAGLEVQVGYIGSCASGRLEDLHAAADILRGRKIKAGFTLHVVPTSAEIMDTATKDGTIAALVEAGASIAQPTCDYCYGRSGKLTSGQRAVSTGTLNVKGRMGATDAELYLCSAATIAASAIEGAITDPRPYIRDFK